MTANFDSKKVISLQKRSLHELAKACWGDFVLTSGGSSFDDDSDDFIAEETEKIIAHRRTVVKGIADTLSSSIPKDLRGELVEAVIRIQRGYHEALVCAELHKIEHGFLTPNPLMTTGPYSAKNFIDPSGHFDELTWAHRFVSDESRSVFGRFELACFYCFEDTIRQLWFSEMCSGRRPYQGSFEDIRKKSSYLVAIWVCWLDGKFDQVVEADGVFAHGFYVGGFKTAKDHYLEHAARFFWARCSDTVKAHWMGELSENADDEDISIPAFTGYAGYVNFIYSLLSLEEKRNLMSNNVEDNSHIWSCLLLSRYYKPVLNDIITTPFPLSNIFYERMLSKLASKLVGLPISEYKEIEALWNHLSQEQRNDILETGTEFIRLLTELKDLDLLEWVILPFPPAFKERMLLHDWQNSGISAIDAFSKEGDYDAMLRYLLLFVNRDPETPRYVVRGDASDLLARFTSGDHFTLWIKQQIPESEKQEVKKVLESLQGSLHVMHSLLDRVELMYGTKPSGVSVSEDGGFAPTELKRSLERHIEGANRKKQKLNFLNFF